jgi:hypothetical protein
MRVKLSYLTPLLAAGAAAAAISAAPIASAASTQQSCSDNVSGSVCESPGNVQINDTPGAMDFQPYGDDGLLLGGYGGFGHGGGFGGGFGGGHGGGGHGGR